MTDIVDTADPASDGLVADQLRRVISDQLVKINDHDIEGFLEFCDPDVVFTFPGTSLFGGEHRGRDQLARFFGMLFQIVGDLQFDYLNILVLGDLAAIEWQDHGHTFRGEPFDNAGVTIMHFRNGLLVEVRDHLDTQKLAAFGSLGRAHRGSSS
jgi:ketosteroid isomerase-like protein